MIDEWDAGILSVHAVAGNAVMRESLFAILPVFVGVGLRVLLLLVSHKEVMLGEGDRLRFDLARRGGLATGQPHDANRGDCGYRNAHL